MNDTVSEEQVDNDNKKFNIDLSAIESVNQVDQDEELQSLGLSVFDQSVFEKGVIQQFEKAFTNDNEQRQSVKDDSVSSEREEGEIDLPEESKDEGINNSKKNDLSDNSNSIHNPINKIENYLRAQLKLHEIRKLQARSKNEKTLVTTPFKNKSLSSKKNVKIKSEVEIEDTAESNEKVKKGKYVGPGKKRKKKEKLGTKKRKCSGANLESPALQPGEENYFYNNTSGSEYIPSDESASSTEFKLKVKKKPKTTSPKKKKKQRKQYLFYERPDTDDSDWDSDYDITKRKGTKELDDGDLELYCRRISKYEKNQQVVAVEEVADEFVMPVDIWESLYDYQKEAVKWFWNLNKQFSGGILGDEMGLGKTVQIIAFLAGLHRSKLQDEYSKYEGLGPTLIVCPTTVMHQWVREFHKWYPPIRVAILHESGTYNGKDRSKLVHNIHCDKFYGVIITSYSGLVQYQDTIIPKDWHYVILDEGHKIRNSKAKVTEVAKQLDTPHRIILSGSPLQNNLQELWCLFDFICPGKLGTVQVFTENFAVPIMQGGYANASQTQVITAHKCATILKDTITPYLLRRMKEDVGGHINLPEKKEQVLFCRLTDEQRELYKHYLESVSIEDMIRGKARLFVALVNLRKICNHPDLYSGGPERDFKISSENGPPTENHFGYWERAGKMIVIETLLKLWNKQGHRVLLFTQSKMMLTVMEDFAKRKNYKYLKLDGQTSISARQPLIDKFNKDATYFLMLLTTKVGGLGVNLTGANRVVIYDPDWNPATDTQARERAWRIGQERDVTIYRLVTAGTIEEKIYHRQIFKQFLSNKILKDPRQRRFFKSNDLIELFTLSETVKNGTTETAAIFAGTGSEIKVPKKVPNKAKKTSVNDKITFSENKIEQMKKLAQALSKKITADNTLNNSSESIDKNNLKDKDQEHPSKSEGNSQNITTEDSIYGPDGTINLKSALELVNSSKLDDSNKVISQAVNCDTNENVVKPVKRKSSEISSVSEVNNNFGVKAKKRKKYKEKFSTFEGQEVPHLVKKRNYKNQKDPKNEEKYESQDDYVLHKLFSKGLETAMHHDTIMSGGPSDFALVEAEAERVAQDALKSLKESSQNQVKQLNLRLKGRDRREGEELLSVIKKRNMIAEASFSEKVLLKDMIMWLQSQGGTSSTDQLVQEFRSKVGEGKSAVFKSLLEKIARFYRAPDRVGYWTIRDEFTSPSTSSS